MLSVRLLTVVAAASRLFVAGDNGDTTFRCEHGGPSATVPTSVHRVTPGDIKVIAAMGDSLTVGAGAGAHNLLQMFKEYRGLAFSIGGDDSLSEMVTIPNILRKFNPHLIGQSHGVGKVDDIAHSQLNVAVSGASIFRIITEARELVHRINTSFPQIDMARDWKLVTFFIGGHALCYYCSNAYAYNANRWYQHAKVAINYMKQHMPRTIVQIVNLPHIELYREVNRIACVIVHQLECKCLNNKTFTNADFSKIVKEYQAEAKKLTNGQFDTSDDFTVIEQPFVADTLHPPYHSDGKVDYGWFAPDCFHWSKRGHSTIARALWNNMVEAVGSKTKNTNLSHTHLPLKCPAPDCPYIRTTRNSHNCASA